MANFGFSIGDVVMLSTLAWKTYTACKEAGNEFAETSQEILSLHLVIRDLGDQIADPKSLVRMQGKVEALQVLLDGCESTLRTIHLIVGKCSTLGGDHKRLRDRVRLALADLASLRIKVAIHIGALNTFIANMNSVALSRLIRRLDKSVKYARAEGATDSASSLASCISDVTEIDARWERYKLEMVMEGLPRQELEGERDFAIAFLSGRLDSELESISNETEMLSRRSSSPGRSTSDLSI